MRTFFLALSGLILAACGGETMDPNDPLASYIPWDPDRSGVQTTESGLQYVVVREGEEGGESPGARDEVEVLYEGRLVDGTFFDGNYDSGSPILLPLNRVIPGWTEGVQLMSVGDEFIFYVPTELGYNQNPRPGGVIQPGDDLIFRIELKGVTKAPEPRPTADDAWAQYTPWNPDLPEVQSTESGLQYVVLASGDEAGINPQGADRVVVFYEGRLDDGGTVFDSAYQRGESAMFQANRLIPGWVEALQLMRPGDHWLIHVPSDLAYGPRGQGPIPGGAALNFELELIDVVPAQ